MVAPTYQIKIQDCFVYLHMRCEIARPPCSGVVPVCHGPLDFPAVEHAQAKAGRAW